MTCCVLKNKTEWYQLALMYSTGVRHANAFSGQGDNVNQRTRMRIFAI